MGFSLAPSSDNDLLHEWDYNYHGAWTLFKDDGRSSIQTWQSITPSRLETDSLWRKHVPILLLFTIVFYQGRFTNTQNWSTKKFQSDATPMKIVLIKNKKVIEFWPILYFDGLPMQVGLHRIHTTSNVRGGCDKSHVDILKNANRREHDEEMSKRERKKIPSRAL